MAKQRTKKIVVSAGPKGKSISVSSTGLRPTRGRAKTTLQSKSARNDLLAAIADPWGQPATRYPDGIGSNTTVAKTRHRIPVATAISGINSGMAVMLLRPTIGGGAFSPGFARQGANGTVQFHCLTAGSADYTNYTTVAGASSVITAPGVQNVVGDRDFESLVSQADAVRPTAMGVKVTYIGAPLTAKGRLVVNAHDANEQFCPFDPPGVNAMSTVFPYTSSYVAVADGLDGEYSMEQPANVEAEIIWVPEAPESALWRNVPGDMGAPYQNYGQYASRGSFGIAENVVPSNTPAGTNRYLGPALHPTSPTSGTFELDGNWQNLPYISLVWEGLDTASTSPIIEVEITIHWEIEVRSNLSVLGGSRPNISNPLELAQAINVSKFMPRISYPSIPNEPGTQSRALAVAEASRLYKTNDQKSAIEGTSFLSGLKAIASKGLKFAGSRLATLGGIPGAIGAGAAMLGQLLA